MFSCRARALKKREVSVIGVIDSRGTGKNRLASSWLVETMLKV